MDFMIIGFPKCGTTSVILNLSKSSLIEVLPGEPRLQDVLKTIDQTAKTKKLRGLKNPSIMYELDQWAPLLRGGTKLVVCYRDPVQYLQCYYRYRKLIHPESSITFEEIVFKNQNFDGLSLPTARFDIFLRQLYRLVDFENVLLLPLDMAAKTPRVYYRILFSFLGLAPSEADRIPLTVENKNTVTAVDFADSTLQFLRRHLQASWEVVTKFADRSMRYHARN